jgi:hypothetical protein
MVVFPEPPLGLMTSVVLILVLYSSLWNKSASIMLRPFAKSKSSSGRCAMDDPAHWCD